MSINIYLKIIIFMNLKIDTDMGMNTYRRKNMSMNVYIYL